MKTMIAFALLSAGTAQADVLGLNDYESLFAAQGAAIEQLADGSEVLSLPADVQVMRSDRGITTLDLGPSGAVGCFVRILSQIAAYQAACDDPFDAGQMARLADYRDQVLTFYAANAQPAADLTEARARFDALIAASVPNTTQYCGGDSDIRPFMDSVLSPDTADVVAAMIEVPRLPADNPCL